MSNKVVTRYAPSPTGNPHIGTGLYALLNYIYARQKGGKVIMRSEDTNKERSTKEFEDSVIENLKWLGIEADEFYRQSERTNIYKKYLEKLVADDKAYVSKEENVEDGKRSEVIRLRNPNKIVSFVDMARGEIQIDTTDLGDFVIAKDFETPLYNFTVVVDDHEMGITHIIRGEDGISNTPRQIVIQKAIGAKQPIYSHFAFILAPDRSKLSKRHGAKSIDEYKKDGYLPQALNNFLLLLAWHPKDEQEIFTMSEMIEQFELERMSKSGAIYDKVKLDWINKEHLKKMSDAEYEKAILPFKPSSLSNDLLKRLLPDLRERLNYFGELTVMAEAGEFDFYTKTPSPSEDLIVSNTKVSINEIREFMAVVSEKLKEVSDFTKENIKQKIWDFATEKGRGNVLWPMRVILTGREKSPDPFTVAEILGKEETIKRLVNVN